MSSHRVKKSHLGRKRLQLLLQLADGGLKGRDLRTCLGMIGVYLDLQLLVSTLQLLCRRQHLPAARGAQRSATAQLKDLNGKQRTGRVSCKTAAAAPAGC
jgi:hypothetical protein